MLKETYFYYDECTYIFIKFLRLIKIEKLIRTSIKTFIKIL